MSPSLLMLQINVFQLRVATINTNHLQSSGVFLLILIQTKPTISTK